MSEALAERMALAKASFDAEIKLSRKESIKYVAAGFAISIVLAIVVLALV